MGLAYHREKLVALDEDGRIEWSGTGRPYLKRYLDEQEGTPASSMWVDIPPISAAAAERLHYPTQKPEELLERIITASSNEGDVVLDPFCGCGTAISVAESLHRNWIGIDITHLAIGLIRHRLHNAYGDTVTYEVIGEPVTIYNTLKNWRSVTPISSSGGQSARSAVVSMIRRRGQIKG